jgi:transcriptional regulator with XRE-family HTH domain
VSARSTVSDYRCRVGYAEELTIARATEEIARVLHERGWSQADLARRLGVTQSSVSQVLAGSNASLRTLARYAHALDRKWDMRLIERCPSSPVLP